MIGASTQSGTTRPDLAAFRDLYPWQGKFHDRGAGIRMHCVDEGRGEPIVMLHGNPTWSFFYRHLIAALSGRYRTIAPDHVGCGLSDKPPARAYDYVLEQRVTDLESLLAACHVTRDVTLVVHDWGGMIGLAYALRDPSRVRRLILMNTAGFGLPQGRSLPWPIKVARDLPLSALAVRGLNLFSAGAAMTCSARPGGLDARVRRAYLAPYDSWANRVAVHEFVRDIPLAPGDRSFDAMDRVSRGLDALADLPCLVLWGERDYVFDGSFLAEWRRRLPNAQFVTFPTAGHYLLEDAHEAIVPRVEAFLREHPLATAPPT